MKVIVSGKNIRLTERLREHSTGQLAAIQKYFDHINEVDLVLSVEKHKTIENSQKAEAQVWVNGSSFKAKCASADMYAAITGVADKIEAQLKKYKEKMKENRHRRGSINRTAEQRELTHKVVKISPDDGEKKKKPRIVRSNTFAAKPMSIEEAAEQLRTLEQDFVVFSNADTNEVNVVYRRADGNIGLIEPAFK
ncbi:MAG: ribosome-associated translation inhibitor RaiA [Candidatus Wallbacteria bacterium]|nr:ribosome-associated translation inhibitor RaiA [Candidatus Wallbacteria bacterium]